MAIAKDSAKCSKCASAVSQHGSPAALTICFRLPAGSDCERCQLLPEATVQLTLELCLPPGPETRAGARQLVFTATTLTRHPIQRAVLGQLTVDEVESLLTQLPVVDRGRILLMPQGITRAELAERGPAVADACKEHGFRYCPRLHVELYGNRRGT